MCQDANEMYADEEDARSVAADVLEARRDEKVAVMVKYIWANDADLQEAMMKAIEEDEGDWIKDFGAEMGSGESRTAALTLLTKIIISVREHADMLVSSEE